jgi:BirA family biotin operon repressor/biotin-[acetyl-CoA-carboxylase] ligase
MMREPTTFVASFRGLCATLGQDVRVDLPDGSVLAGTADGIDDHGRLLVESSDGTTAVAAGDVVHVRGAE